MPISRFLAILMFLLISFATFAGTTDSTREKYLLYVGTYTGKGSKGIYAYRLDMATSQFVSLGVAAATENPSFLAIDPSHRFLYAVNEVQSFEGAKSGAVSAFAIDAKTAKLTLLNEVASRGADPCYIVFDKTGKYTLVANYTGGSIAVFPVLADGKIGPSTAFVQHSGSSLNHERQEGPHAHWIDVTPDNRFVLAVDLGLDKVLVYRFDANSGKLTANDPAYAKLDAGSGPRHLAFAANGKFLYVLNELRSTITAFSYDVDHGDLHALKTISALPRGFYGENTAAEIAVHPNGKFLYASNRGNDTIAVFAIDSGTGELTLVDHFSTQGKTPRDFKIDPTGRLLLVANQDSNNIVVFRIDPNSGRLAPTGQTLEVPSPVALKFTPAQ